MGLKRHSSLLCRRINSIHQGRGYQHVLLCPTTAEICTNECCAYTCVLNHQMPFPARTSISDFQPWLCKLPKALLLRKASRPGGDSLLKGCSQPVGSAGGNNHSAGHNHAAACPAPPPGVRKLRALALSLNCHTLPTSYSPETGGKPLLPGVGWEPSSRSMGWRAASSNALRSPS